MKVKKISMFKAVNGFMALFCAGALYVNYVGVNVISTEKATSSVGNNNFEYQTTESLLSINRNGEKVGVIPTDKSFKFKKNSYIPNLNCNAVAVGVKVVATGTAVAGAGSTILGCGVATGAAAAVLPTAGEVALLGLGGAMAAVGGVVLVATGAGLVLG